MRKWISKVKARPSYPSAALNVICSLFSNPLSSKKILDLGAGTGIMTKLLVERGFDVTAVEPVDGMREKLSQELPEVTALEGNSYSIPVTSESQDAVVLAQCFHWFDNVKSLQEIHRVLKPGGYLFLIWNMESRERCEWLGKLREYVPMLSCLLPEILFFLVVYTNNTKNPRLSIVMAAGRMPLRQMKPRASIDFH